MAPIDNGPKLVDLSLEQRLERILDSTVAAILEHDRPVVIADDPQIRTLLIGVRQQDAALADRAWWLIEGATAARALELAEMVSEQTAAAADYLQHVALEEEDGFEELPGGTLLFRCPVEGCETTIGITGPADGGDSDDDVQAVIDFHEQVFAHEALHQPRGEQITWADIVADAPATPVPDVSEAAERTAGAIMRRAADDMEQAAALRAWASQPRAFARARTQWLVGLVVMVTGIVVGAFATPPADGRTILALVLILAGFAVSYRGAHRMQDLAKRMRG